MNVGVKVIIAFLKLPFLNWVNNYLVECHLILCQVWYFKKWAFLSSFLVSVGSYVRVAGRDLPFFS